MGKQVHQKGEDVQEDMLVGNMQLMWASPFYVRQRQGFSLQRPLPVKSTVTLKGGFREADMFQSDQMFKSLPCFMKSDDMHIHGYT